jgi:hypothetical protein
MLSFRISVFFNESDCIDYRSGKINLDRAKLHWYDLGLDLLGNQSQIL